MKIIKGKSKRTVIFSVITVLAVLLLLAANMLMTYFGLNKAMYVDLTPEGLYTLTDAMVRECAFIDELGKADGEKEVKVTFCTDPDYMTNSTLMRLTYFMALKMQNEYDNFKVETVNVENDPTALSKYKTTSLTVIEPTDIIVSYGDRYRIVGASNFWTTDSTTSQYFSYNGEYRLATLIKSVTAIEQPTAYFLTGHGEKYYDPQNPNSPESLECAQLYELLHNRGLSVKLLNLKEEQKIPDDCALLIINNPTEDFLTDSDKYDELAYVSELEILDRYLVNNQGAIMVARDYRATKLSRFDDFLREWGFSFGEGIVLDSDSSVAGKESDLITVYETEENSFANAIYEEFASLATSPKTIISNTGYITNSYGDSGMKNEAGSMFTVRRYASFLQSSEKANAYDNDKYFADGIKEISESRVGALDLAAVTVREAFDSDTNEYTHSYIFCAASAEFFSNALLSNASYANYDIVSALVNNISRTDVYASMELGGTSLNSSSYGGKILVDDSLSAEDVEVYDNKAGQYTGEINYGMSNAAKTVYTVVIAIVPAVFLVLGIITCVKRKFL